MVAQRFYELYIFPLLSPGQTVGIVPGAREEEQVIYFKRWVTAERNQTLSERDERTRLKGCSDCIRVSVAIRRAVRELVAVKLPRRDERALREPGAR